MFTTDLKCVKLEQFYLQTIFKLTFIHLADST